MKFLDLQSGGPSWEVQMGRKNSLGVSKAAATYNIPGPNSTVPGCQVPECWTLIQRHGCHLRWWFHKSPCILKLFDVKLIEEKLIEKHKWHCHWQMHTRWEWLDAQHLPDDFKAQTVQILIWISFKICSSCARNQTGIQGLRILI